ncbi:hypothetical protein Godav_025216 [Gossypium davidsonii]|uniref:DUF7745 domain-containing protein n=1 Tax=Gossypium davidsonii TaxID=34287 RepID=A0A7J8TG66_GOSDV|nr:hypothetical protein [Gossypium davidsonii]
MNITGMSEWWITTRIKQKGECKCIPQKNLRDLILAHPNAKKKVDMFALSIYGLMIFPRVLGYVDEAVLDLFDRLDKGVTPVTAILAETFRSLNACRRTVFSENYSPLKEIVATPRRDDILKENWIALLQNLQEEDVEWKAPWLIPDKILYRCGSFDWVPLLGIWGAIGYAPLLCEFSYRGDNYKKRVKKISNAWNQTYQMKRLAVESMTTPEYSGWWSKKINDNIPEPNLRGVRPMEDYELRMELLEVNEERWKEQLHHSQNQFRNRDYIMGEAVAQIQEVADHLQTLVIQSDVLSVKYELESDRGQELASLFRKVKTLSIRAKPYL